MARPTIGESQDTEWVNAAELAKILGVTPRMVGYYIDAGIPTNDEIGKKRLFPVNQARQWWIAYKEKLKSKDDGDISESDARVRKLLVEARLKELELLKEQQVLVETDYAIHLMDKKLAVIRNRLQIIPGKYASEFVQLGSVGEAVNTLTSMVTQVLTEIAEEHAAMASSPTESE